MKRSFCYRSDQSIHADKPEEIQKNTSQVSFGSFRIHQRQIKRDHLCITWTLKTLLGLRIIYSQ